MEKNLGKSNAKEEQDGQFILVYWKEDTFVVIHVRGFLVTNKDRNGEGFLTCRAKHDKKSAFDVVFVITDKLN